MAPHPIFLAPFITTLFFFFLSIPISHQTTLLQTPTISAAPAVLPDPPLSPYTALSPDEAPLLPSPGRAKSPTGLSVPTIPSTRSQNPDMVDSVDPDYAVAPSASVMDSSAFCIVKGFTSGVLAFWLVVLFFIIM